MRFFVKLGLAFLIAVLPAAAATTGATTTRAGIYDITIKGNILSPVAEGVNSAICTLTLTTNDPFAQTDTGTSSATIENRKFSCNIHLDYGWTLENASSTVSAAWNVQLVNTNTAAVPRTSGALVQAPSPIMGDSEIRLTINARL